MTAPAALGYFWGDDGLSLDQATVALADRIARAAGSRPDRWRVETPANVDEALVRIAELFERVATTPMFGGGVLAVVGDPLPFVRAKESRDALVAVLGAVAPGNGLAIVESTTETKPERRPAALRALEAAVRAAGGIGGHFPAPKAGLMAAWIERAAADRGMRLGRGAAKTLAERIGAFATEVDVDRRGQAQLAAHELDKLALYRPGVEVSADDVRALVADVVPPSVFAFSNALGERRIALATRMLDQLFDVIAEPALIVIIHRCLRELLEVADRLAAGESPGSLVRTMKLHPYRGERLVAQARRWSPAELERALDDLLEVEVLVKGAEGGPTSDEQLRLAFTLWMAARVAGDVGRASPQPVRG